MGITVVWDDDAKSIIRWDFEDHWTWEEFYQGFDQSLEMAQSVTHRIDVIPETTHTEHMPPGALTQFRRVFEKSPPHMQLTVVTGANTFGRAILNIFIRLNRISTWRIANTLDEARAIIAQDREESQ